MPLSDPWSILDLLAAGLIVGALAYAWTHPVPARVRAPLLALVLGALLFVLGDLGTRHAGTARAHGLALACLYTGVVAVATGFFALATGFAAAQGVASERLRRPLLRGVAAWMTLLWLVAVTNPWHGMLLTPRLEARNEYHALWYVLAASAYVLGLGSAGLLLWVRVRVQAPPVRRHALLLIAAVAAFLGSNLLYVTSSSPWPLDPSVIGLAVAALLFTRVLARDRLFFLSPFGLEELLARDTDRVFVVDAAGALLHANPAARGWAGPGALRPGQDVIAALADRLVVRRPQRATLDADTLRRRLRAGGEVGGLETRRGDVHLRVAASPLHDRRDRLAGHLIRLRDETQLHALAEAATEQAATLRAVVEATDEGLLVYFGDRIHLATGRFFDVWRFPPEARGVRSVRELFDVCLGLVESAEALYAMTDLVSENAGSVVRDDILLRDGRIVESTGHPLAREGRFVGRVWRVRDVTETRRDEVALRHAQKLESLGVMSAGIAHDFNNLLVPVLGNARLLQEQLPNEPETVEMLCDIEAAAEQAGHLTRQLLDYAGRGGGALEPRDPARTVREALALCARSVPKHIAVSCRLMEDPPAVQAEPGQLRQVLANLILNAAEAIGGAPGRIELCAEVQELGPLEGRGLRGGGAWRPGRYVALRVEDTGCGIDADLQERIFDPFFTTKATGRGLGLAATLGIVRSHGGHLRVESEPGRGSRFTVLLPAGDGPAPAEAPPATSPTAPLEATVLVVDDEPAVVRVAERALRRAGMRVLAATDGAQALRIYAECAAEIDVVLLDVGMPRLGGIEVYRKLREMDADVRVVFASGHPERELVAGLRPGESAAFMQKPYVPADLVDAIREAAGLSS